ncbi:zinc knuckle CX2CX4HX4C containing protein [Tanacetum coccineum]
MMNTKGFLFFKFESKVGLEAVLESGPWMILKLHDVPLQVFEEDGISLIATFIGKPIMLDSYTSSMCKDSWGRSSFARCLIKRPPRCDECKIFGHVHDHCPKKMVNPPIVTTSNVVAPTFEKSNDGFQTVGKKKKRKATTITPKKGATNVSNPSKSSSMLKAADNSPKNDNFTTSNSFSALNDEEEDDEEVENVYDELANLVPNTNTAGSSSFTAAAG